MVPDEILETATRVYLSQRRVDMRALAGELGIGRATLYRRAGDRQRVLGEVIWSLTRGSLERVTEAHRDLRGHARVLAVVESFMREVDATPALQHFLHAEPEFALRVLTDQTGEVQPGIVAALEAVLREEQERGALELVMEPKTVAFLIVRVGETFLYSDVIATHRADIGRALEVTEELLGALDRRVRLQRAA